MTQVKNEVKFRTNSQYAKDWIHGVLQFIFRDGFLKTFDPTKASAENRERAMLYGFEVALERSMAVEIEKFPGKSEREAEQRRRLVAKIAHFESGSPDWDIKAAARGPKPFDSGLVVEAMIRALAGLNTVEAVEDLLAKQVRLGKHADREAALKGWAETSQVKAAIGIIEGERAARASKVDAQAMLAELMGEESDA